MGLNECSDIRGFASHDIGLNEQSLLILVHSIINMELATVKHYHVVLKLRE